MEFWLKFRLRRLDRPYKVLFPAFRILCSVEFFKQQQPTDDRDLGVGDLKLCQPPEPPDGGRESEGVVGGGGGGDDEAGGVERDPVQGEMVLVMSSTLNLTISHLKSSQEENLALP